MQLEYDIQGELSEDGQFILLHHVAILKPIIRQFAGKQLEIRIKEYKNTRSHRQNRYMWGVVIPTIKNWFKDTQGEILTNDEVYAWIKIKLLGVKPVVKTILGTKVIEMQELSFSKMNTLEFAKYTNQIIDEMALRECFIPVPTTNNDLHEMMGGESTPLKLAPGVKTWPEGKPTPSKRPRRFVDDIDDD